MPQNALDEGHFGEVLGRQKGEPASIANRGDAGERIARLCSLALMASATIEVIPDEGQHGRSWALEVDGKTCARRQAPLEQPLRSPRVRPDTKRA